MSGKPGFVDIKLCTQVVVNKMTLIEVHPLDEQYFNEAKSNGHVYGTLQKYVKEKWTTFHVFAWLGREIEYQERSNDDPKTRYKKFVSCICRVALTQQLLDKEEFLIEDKGVTIILYW